MKSKKNDAITGCSGTEEISQKINSPTKKSLSFASSSPSQTNNSSFSKNSFEDVSVVKEGNT